MSFWNLYIYIVYVLLVPWLLGLYILLFALGMIFIFEFLKVFGMKRPGIILYFENYIINLISLASKGWNKNS